MLFFCKSKKSLSDVINPHKKYHPGQHGQIFLHVPAATLQQETHCRLCNPICQEIADNNIDDKLDDNGRTLTLILEGKVLV